MKIKFRKAGGYLVCTTIPPPAYVQNTSFQRPKSSLCQGGWKLLLPLRYLQVLSSKTSQKREVTHRLLLEFLVTAVHTRHVCHPGKKAVSFLTPHRRDLIEGVIFWFRDNCCLKNRADTWNSGKRLQTATMHMQFL